MNELVDYADSDRTLYRQLEDGSWEWVFDVWNGATNEYDEVCKGETVDFPYAVVRAHQAAVDWAVKRAMEAYQNE